MVDVVIGRVGRPHGVRGELSVHPLTDEPARRFVAGAVVTADGVPLRIETVRPHGDRLLLFFAEVADREAAQALTGALLHAEVAAEEDPGEDDAWFDHQLVGLAVRLLDGSTVGSIARVDHGAAQDLLVIRRGEGRARREALVPFVTAIVPTVDIAAGYVVLDPPGGLLDDLDDPPPGPRRDG